VGVFPADQCQGDRESATFQPADTVDLSKPGLQNIADDGQNILRGVAAMFVANRV
jgi:hypothetical protein